MASPDVLCLVNGAFVENCYILADRAAGAAVLVDPGEDAAMFLERLADERLRLDAIWLTHAHLDHILGVGQVVAQTGAPVYLHPADRPLYDRLPEQAAHWFGASVPPLPPPDRTLAARDVLYVGGAAFHVRHVPGHSPGSVAFVGDGCVLAGDALFQGSIGRTDLPGGNTDTLLASIADQLLTLPDATVVYPGHGPATTIGVERASNPFLTGALRLG